MGTHRKPPVCLYFVVPCYNDEETLPVSAPVFLQKLTSLSEKGLISETSALVLLNDGSADGTWDEIRSLQQTDRRIVGINLAHNAGEQNALLAGLSYAAQRADCAVTMDSDLQDDIGAVDEMLEQFLAGKDLALGVRSLRARDPLSERLSSGGFYRLMALSGTKQIREHANYRLMSRKAIGQLLAHTETYYYLPCVVSEMGLERAVVYHERFERAAGSTGYTFLKKLRLAEDAVVTHSAMPLKLISVFALLCALPGAAAAAAGVILWARTGVTQAAFFLIAALFGLGALLLLGMRLLGEYLLKTFREARSAPQRQVETTTGLQD